MAVHLGPVVAGSAEGDLPGRLLPEGPTMALPVRMLGDAEPGEILVSEAVARWVGGWVEIEPRTLRRGTGSGPAEAYAVTGSDPRREGMPAAAPRALGRFVGRARELDVLRQLAARAAAGAGQAVGIVGEPGVGKSRLLYEFHRAWTTGRSATPSATASRGAR
jgi:hypothetical protein